MPALPLDHAVSILKQIGKGIVWWEQNQTNIRNYTGSANVPPKTVTKKTQRQSNDSAA
jgi:hypothetical protein